MNRTEPPAEEAYDLYAEHYARMENQACDWEAASRAPARFASRRPWLPASKEARILDLGCGWGHQLMELWCAGYRNLEGVDHSPGQAEATRRAAGDRIQVHCADGRSFLRGRPGWFDLIVLNDVLEHVPLGEVREFLRDLRGALAKDGVLVVRTPNMSSLLAAHSRFIDVTHLTGFTEASLVQLLEQCGFTGHRFFAFELQWRWHEWRPWLPVRGMPLKAILNAWMHRVLYWLRGQKPRPTQFGANLECWSRRREG